MLLQGWRNHRMKKIEIRKIRLPCNRSRCHKFVNWCGNLNYFDPEHNDLRIGWSWTNSSSEVDFPALKFQSVKLFSKIPYRNENSPTIHHTPVRISSTSMIGHTTSTGSKNTEGKGWEQKTHTTVRRVKCTKDTVDPLRKTQRQPLSWWNDVAFVRMCRNRSKTSLMLSQPSKHTEASKLWRIQRVATLWLEMSPMCQVQRHDQHIHYPNFLYDHTRAAWWAAAYVGHGLETADAQAPAARVYELESCPNKYQQHA